MVAEKRIGVHAGSGRILLWSMMIPALVFFLSEPEVSRAQGLEIQDDLGNRVVLEKPAQRIIPLYGAFGEMLRTIGAGEEVIARTRADNFPEEVAALPSVGTHMKPNVEIILGLKPDLVIQSVSRRAVLPEMERVKDAGIPVAFFSPGSFREIFDVMLKLGVLTGRNEEAAHAVGDLEARLAAVKSSVADLEVPKKVFFEVREQPLTAAGRGSIVHQIIQAAGAQNAIDHERAVVRFNFESLLPADPQVYIVQTGPMNRNPLDPRKRPHFQRVRAVREGRVIFVDELMYSRPGPRCVDAVEELVRKLYPERFSDIGEVEGAEKAEAGRASRMMRHGQ